MCPRITSGMNVQEYWLIIFKEKNALGNHMYPNLTKVISVLFSFPISNASVERVFSQLKLIKSDHRASLKHESLLCLMTSKLWLQQKGVYVDNVAATLDPPEEMVRFHYQMKVNVDDAAAAKLRKQFLKEI